MKFPVALLALALLLSACAGTTPSRSAGSTVRGDAAHPEVGVNWLRTELYFGIGAVDHRDAAANDKRWRDFLGREVSSRFPDGLSVYDIYGQWRSQGHTDIERLHSKEVMLLYADTAQHRADIEAIRSAWKQATGDVSVLRVTQPADVSF
jgi:hypothetical protein